MRACKIKTMFLPVHNYERSGGLLPLLPERFLETDRQHKNEVYMFCIIDTIEVIYNAM